jgi:hypothetical protein
LTSIDVKVTIESIPLYQIENTFFEKNSQPR